MFKSLKGEIFWVLGSSASIIAGPLQTRRARKARGRREGVKIEFHRAIVRRFGKLGSALSIFCRLFLDYCDWTGLDWTELDLGRGGLGGEPHFAHIKVRAYLMIFSAVHTVANPALLRNLD